mmetsp:Transcript_5537/g.12382  ORF Transcript_5537/g.12382 Transcript_5537/m.12382 type:complete len:965 (-) Transcript_5537:1327-4221(-)
MALLERAALEHQQQIEKEQQMAEFKNDLEMEANNLAEHPTVFKKDANGNPIKDAEGNRVIEVEGDEKGFLNNKYREPSLEKAQTWRKGMLWNKGENNLSDTSIDDIGRLGVGLQLYFFTLYFLMVVFAVVSVLSIPQMLINAEANGGKAFNQDERVALGYGSMGGMFLPAALSLAGHGVQVETLSYDRLKGQAAASAVGSETSYRYDEARHGKDGSFKYATTGSADENYFETDMCSCRWMKDSEKLGGGDYEDICVPLEAGAGGDCRMCDSAIDPAHCPMCWDDDDFNTEEYSLFYQFNNISSGYSNAALDQLRRYWYIVFNLGYDSRHKFNPELNNENNLNFELGDVSNARQVQKDAVAKRPGYYEHVGFEVVDDKVTFDDDGKFDDDVYNKLYDPSTCNSSLTQSIMTCDPVKPWCSPEGRVDFEKYTDLPTDFEYGDETGLKLAAEILRKDEITGEGGKWTSKDVCDLLENPTFQKKTWNRGCGWNKVTLWGQEWNARQVSYFITFFEFLISIFLLAAVTIYRFLVEAKRIEHDERYATPYDYTILVRGLPDDVKAADIREHFSNLYDLKKNDAKFYPYYGINPLGAAIIKGCIMFVLWFVLASGTAGGYLSDGGGGSDDDGVSTPEDDASADETSANAAAASLGSTIFVSVVYAIIRYKKTDDANKWYFLWDSGIHPQQRESVEERYDREVGEILTAEQEKKEDEANARMCCGAAKVAPADGIRQSEVVEQTEDETVTSSRLVRVSPKKGSTGTPASGIEPLVEEQVDFTTTYVHEYFSPRPHPEPVKDCSISQDPGYTDLWVAQVALAHPTGSVSRQFTKNQKHLQKLMVAKAKFQKKMEGKTYVKGTPVAGLEKIEAEYDKKRAKYDKKEAKALKGVHSEAMDTCIGAFVSFEHQESAERCIEDYRHSTTLGFGFGFWGWLVSGEVTPILYLLSICAHEPLGRHRDRCHSRNMLTTCT